MVALVEMAGRVFNGTTVVSRSGSTKDGKASWDCICACGANFSTSGSALRRKTFSGCAACLTQKRTAQATTHGAVGTPEYVSYQAMLQRCYYPANKRYERYGGRGIKVCDRWRESFSNFLDDMGPKPSLEHSIERLETDGDYEPSNCVWATKEEQANNRSNNTPITIDGRTQNLTQWSRETGVNRTVILRRMKRGLSGAELIKKGV